MLILLSFPTEVGKLELPLFFCLFVLREREKESACAHAHMCIRGWGGEGQRVSEKERESQAGSTLSAQGPTPGWNAQTMRS